MLLMKAPMIRISLYSTGHLTSMHNYRVSRKGYANSDDDSTQIGIRQPHYLTLVLHCYDASSEVSFTLKQNCDMISSFHGMK